MNARLLVFPLLGLLASRAHAQIAAPAPEPVPAPVSPAPSPDVRGRAPGAPVSPYPPGPSFAPPDPYRLPPPRLYPSSPPPKRRYGDAGAPFAFGIGASILWRDDAAYELFRSGQRSSAFELLASYDVWVPARGVIFATGASVRFEALSGDGPVDLWHSSAQAELLARFRAASWLWPQLRVGLGVVSTRVRAADDLSQRDFQDRAPAFASTFGAGFTVRTPARLFETYRGRLASLSLGLSFEGGYTLAEAAELELKPTRASDLERPTISLGSIERRGAYLRMLAVVRF